MDGPEGDSFQRRGVRDTKFPFGSQSDLSQRWREQRSREMVGVTYWSPFEGEQPAGVQAAEAPGLPLRPAPQESAAGARSPRDSGMQGVQDRSGTDPLPSPPQTWRKGYIRDPRAPGPLLQRHLNN